MFVLFALSSFVSASSFPNTGIFSRLALGLSLRDDIRASLLSQTEWRISKAKQLVRPVCHVVDCPAKNGSYYFSDFDDLDRWFESKVSKKPLTLKRAFRYLLQGLNSSETDDLFQLSPKTGKPYIYDCSAGFNFFHTAHDSIDLAQYLVAISSPRNDKAMNSKVSLNMNIKIESGSNSHHLKTMRYSLALIIAEIENDYVIFEPVIKKNREIRWKSHSIYRDFIGDIFTLPDRFVHRITDLSHDQIQDIIASNNSLYLYSNQTPDLLPSNRKNGLSNLALFKRNFLDRMSATDLILHTTLLGLLIVAGYSIASTMLENLLESI